MAEVECSSLSKAEQKIVEAALQVKDKAHCPYSKFKVGAALISGSGTTYEGCNIENAAYPLSTCAERTAIVKAVSNRETSIKCIAVVTNTEDFLAPCGGCRQNICEFGHSSNCVVLMVRFPGDRCLKTTIKDLLPYSPGPNALEVLPNIGEIVQSSELDISEKQIVKDALVVMKNSHCTPHSSIAAGAALVTESGDVFKGCTVENAVQSLSTCAVRSAITIARSSQGDRPVKIKSLAVVANNYEGFARLCGGCRQIVSEFGPDCTVLMVKYPGKECIRVSNRDLLPFAFGPAALEKPPLSNST